MFVTRAEAEARLGSTDNLTRSSIPLAKPPTFTIVDKATAKAIIEKGIANLPTVDEQIEKKALAQPKTPIVLDPLDNELANLGLSNADFDKLTGGRGDNPFIIPSFDKLDALINPRVAGHPRYRMHREAQKGIAETDLVLGHAITGSLYELGPNQAHAYGRGETSEGAAASPIPEIKKHLDKVKAEIALSASVRLKRIVGRLDATMIDAIDNPKDLTQIGKDVAQILDRVSDKEGKEAGDGVHFHVYRPEVNQTQNYNVVTVNRASE